jgi:CDP-6-deoxy-D-xylo-4-hexulose-3-dehydrase
MDKNIAISNMVSAYKQLNQETKFIPGETFISHASKVISSEEIFALSEAVLDGWFTAGRFCAKFELKLKKFFDIRSATLVNSGSSANLVAMSSLTSSTLGERSINPGDEVITVATSFPTTVNPILQVGAIPVFIDVDIPSYNMDVSKLNEAKSNKTKAVIIAHTLGNPFNLDEVQRFCEKNNLWLIEDNCDAMGSKYRDKLTGTFGDLASLSFYPAHHITTGEGGAVLTSSAKLRVLVESFRDWGRDCYCEPGKDNTCLKRFDQQHGDLPFGYDHKFVYSHVGYNLKMTDFQGALGSAQMDKLPSFINKRRENWLKLRSLAESLEENFILPYEDPITTPSWYGFALTIRPDSKLDRTSLLRYLDEKKIGTRLLFAGDLTRQPSFKDKQYRIVGELNNTNLITRNTFWIGCWPGLENEQLEFMISTIKNFVRDNIQ